MSGINHDVVISVRGFDNVNGCIISFFFNCKKADNNFFFFSFIIVEKLARTGSKMVIISNSSRRASTTIDKMKSLGFDTSLFVGAITSGELTHQYLQRFTFKIAIHYALFHDGHVSTSHMLHFL